MAEGLTEVDRAFDKVLQVRAVIGTQLDSVNEMQSRIMQLRLVTR